MQNKLYNDYLELAEITLVQVNTQVNTGKRVLVV